MSLIQEAKRAARDHLPGMYARWAAREKRRLPEQIPAIVSSPMPYKYCDEATFSRLQKEFAQVWPDYSESEFSNWRRAVDRVAYIVQLPTFAGRSGLKMLEAACSDGMT